MTDRQVRMYNKYVRGHITLKELLKWNSQYLKDVKEREVKHA